jgi:AcrR family transcriptional regulator
MLTKIDRTKQHIIQTFFEMMAEVGFEQIRVSSLAKKAGINRGTFYHHFTDKYEILEEIENDIYTQFESLMEDKVLRLERYNNIPSVEDVPRFFQHSILQTMLFLYERKEIAIILVGKNGSPYFIEKLESLFYETVRNTMSTNSQHGSDQMHYLQEFVFSGITSVIKSWLRNGAKEAPEEIANLLAASLTTPPVSLVCDFLV